MRGALPGTKHSTVIDKREPAIFASLAETKGVKKIEPSRIRWTGPRPPRLRLRDGIFNGVYEGWLYLGSAKRLCLICPEPGVKIEELQRNLTAALIKFGVAVVEHAGTALELLKVALVELTRKANHIVSSSQRISERKCNKRSDIEQVEECTGAVGFLVCSSSFYVVF